MGFGVLMIVMSFLSSAQKTFFIFQLLGVILLLIAFILSIFKYNKSECSTKKTETMDQKLYIQEKYYGNISIIFKRVITSKVIFVYLINIIIYCYYIIQTDNFKEVTISALCSLIILFSICDSLVMGRVETNLRIFYADKNKWSFKIVIVIMWCMYIVMTILPLLPS